MASLNCTYELHIRKSLRNYKVQDKEFLSKKGVYIETGKRRPKILIIAHKNLSKEKILCIWVHKLIEIYLVKELKFSYKKANIIAKIINFILSFLIKICLKL